MSSTDTPPYLSYLVALAASGLVIAYFTDPKRLFLLAKHSRGLWFSFFLFGIVILSSEAIATLVYFNPYDPRDGFHAGIVLCLPALAFFLTDRKWLKYLVTIFAAICVWHFFMMPIEAVNGWKLSWHPINLYPREEWIFKYEASGLALWVYYFAGFFLPLFYLTAGLIWKGNLFERFNLSPRALMLANVLWLVPVISAQSRSAFIGAGAASLLMIFNLEFLRRGKLKAPANLQKKLIIAGIILLGAGVFYFRIMSVGKSSFGMRLDYLKLYFEHGIQWPYVLTGHGYLAERRSMYVPGTQWHAHSHNDWVEILFVWGGLGLLAYLHCWYRLLRAIFIHFVPKFEFWPFCPLIAIFPHSMSDLGFIHLEKAFCLLLTAAVVLAVSFRRKNRIA